jgi:hypothetical protein
VGEACILPDTIPEAQINRALGRVIARENLVSTRFLETFLNSDLGRFQLVRYSQGGMQKRFNTPDGVFVRVPVPEDKHLQQIICDRYDKILAKANEIRSRAQDTSAERLLLLGALDVVFASELGLPALPTEQVERFYLLPVAKQGDRLDVLFNQPTRRDIEGRLLALGTRMTRLSDVLELENERLDSTALDAYIGLEHIESSVGRVERSAAIDVVDTMSTANAVKNKRILYGRLRPCLNKVAWIDGDESWDGVGCSTEIWVCKTKGCANGRLLAAFLRSNYGLGQLKYLPAGARPRVQEDDFLSVLV